MAKGQSFSRHQQGIINRYYEHQDTILSNRLGEIVSDLYLADAESKRKRLWSRAAQALAKSKVEPKRYEPLVASRDLQALATLVNELAGPGETPQKGR
ncbi:MAG: hypothetical protein OER86_04095 [Phycisphaerae bacterium]|nr:hypothetical protein [Phycisphaerae bacterium]